MNENKFIRMKSIRIFKILPLLCTLLSFGQQNNKWSDLYSYKQIKSIIINNQEVIGLSDNAFFVHDSNQNITNKVSSVQGLSGQKTTSIIYDKINLTYYVGYQSGLIETYNADKQVKKIIDIQNATFTTDKRINAFYIEDGTLYIATNFGLVLYNLSSATFLDTYFIGNNSSSVIIHDVFIENNIIYAASENGLYYAPLSSNLNDFTSWSLINIIGETKDAFVFNNKVYVAKSNEIYELNNNILSSVKSLASPIISETVKDDKLWIAHENKVISLDVNLTQEDEIDLASYTLNDIKTDGFNLFAGTENNGIQVIDLNTLNIENEINLPGPFSNAVYDMAYAENHIWMVYGGYDEGWQPMRKKLGMDHFDGETWHHIPYSATNVQDLSHITIDRDNPDKAYISSYEVVDGGVMVIENNEMVEFWGKGNSTFEDLLPTVPSIVVLRIPATAYDQYGDLWVSNPGNPSIYALHNFNFSDENWTAHQNSEAYFYSGNLIVDNNDNVLSGSRSDGLSIYNTKTEDFTILLSGEGSGNLPSNNVRCFALDKDNRVWIGTQRGLAVIDNSEDYFDGTKTDTDEIIILENGIARKLMGTSTINTIAIDGADNLWFGTSTGGIIQTSASGQKTLNIFNKSNSPLPSNNIIDIEINKETGLVYIVTDAGVLTYDSDVVSFGADLDQVYAYPNPVLKNHDFVTIAGKNGKALPEGTNVKIIDVSGQLVYETNTLSSQSQTGGKIIWDKTNLAGRKVASGIYIVMLYNEELAKETMTKIAIVN